MKKINQLVVIEGDPLLQPLFTQHEELLQTFSGAPVITLPLQNISLLNANATPQLVILHMSLTGIRHLAHFVELQNLLPNSTIVIVGQRHEEELCLLALEAGAEDSIAETHLNPSYLQKIVLLSIRRSRTETELAHGREQLLACIQNTPNVAVQWYNSAGIILFWNHASEIIFGWTAEEAIGKTLEQLILAPEEEVVWLHKINGIGSTLKASEPLEWAFKKRDGSEGCCISTLFPIPSFSGETWFVCMDVDISKQKRTENALRESEQRYHSIFSQASDAIFINDDNGQILDINERACELLQYSREQLLQKKITDFYSKEELAARPIMWRELLAGERTSLERNILASDGATVPVEITAHMFTANRIMAIVRNVTDRKKAEEALMQSKERYRSLVEEQADAIVIFDEEGQIVDVNTSATQMLQYEKAALTKMKLVEILSPKEVQTNPVQFDLLKNGERTIKQRVLQRRDGSQLETEVHAKRLYDGCFMATIRDLTERIQVQHQLEKEKELSDSIINSLPGLFYLYKKDGTFLRWNKQFEINSGYSATEISKMTPLNFFYKDDALQVAAAIEKVFNVGQAHIEANLYAKSGTKTPYYFTGIKISYAGTDCLLGTGIDLSAIKGLEKELSEQKIAGQKKIMQAMIDAQEKEKSNLGVELHDNINQILSVVRMYLTILKSNDIPEGITLSRTAELLNNAMEEIRNLSHGLAVSYAFEAGLPEALSEMIEKIRLTKDFSITLTTPPDINEKTNGNQKLALYRIVQEQVSNIIRHAKATEVNVVMTSTPQQVTVTITDNGRGFNAARTEKGLGLNNITNRAEALGGKVVITSAPGAGCKVEATIPL